MDVGAVNDGVGISETMAKRLVGRNAADQRLVERVVHHHLIGINGARAGPFADAQRVEGGKRIGPQLDAGADLAQLRRLLQHFHGEALPGERKRGRQAADAATGNNDGQGS